MQIFQVFVRTGHTPGKIHDLDLSGWIHILGHITYLLHDLCRFFRVDYLTPDVGTTVHDLKNEIFATRVEPVCMTLPLPSALPGGICVRMV